MKTTAERKPDALLPCPFCGNTDIANDEGCFRSGEWWEVRCGNPSCFAHDPGDESRVAAIARWNRRAPNPAIEALIEVARRILSCRYSSSATDFFECCDMADAALALWQPAAPDDSEARK